MVILGESVILTTLCLGRLRLQKRLHRLSPVNENCPSRISGRRKDPGHLALESDVLLTAVSCPAPHRRKVSILADTVLL